MLVVGGIGLGVSLVGQEDEDMREVEVVDEPTPSLTVKPTPTTTSPEDGDASPEATGDLTWSEFALPGSDGGAQTTISWAGSTFARTEHPGCCPQLELSHDGRSWSRVTDLPDTIGGKFGELRGIAGWGDELAIWGTEHRNDGSRPVVATSVDGGASWTELELDGLETGMPDLAYVTYTTRVVDAAVKDGTVVVLTETTVSFDLVDAMRDAGLPVGPIDHATLLPGGASVEWVDGDPHGTYVQYCVDASCSSTQRIPLGELGIDTERLPLRQRTVLAHRADASGGFASIDLDTDLDDGLGVHVVDGAFVIIGHAAFRDATIMSSLDGAGWTAAPMGGTYPTQLATDDDHLLALDPGGELRRSGDLGRTWEVVGSVDPDIEVLDMEAGRAGLVLLAVRRSNGAEVLAWSRDGTTFNLRSPPDALDIDGGRPGGDIGESPPILPGERLVTQDTGWSPSLAVGDAAVVVAMAVSDPLREVSRDEDGGEAAAWIGIPDPEDPTVQLGAAVRPRLFVAEVG